MGDRLGTDSIARQLRADRAVRDAARALVDADMAHFRADLGGKDIKTRVLDRITEGAVDVLEEAVEVAESNKAALITLLAAIGLWFARNPIMGMFSDTDEYDDDEYGTDDGAGYEPDETGETRA